jgi:hypothetical protein
MTPDDASTPDPGMPGRLVMIDGEVDGLLADETWRLSDDELELLMEEVHGLAARLVAVRGRLHVEAFTRGFATRHGAGDLAAWLRDRFALATFEARRQVSLARDLDGPCRATGAALAAGLISLDHAWVICQGMRSLSAEISAEERARAERILLDNARSLDPHRLVKVAAHLREQLTRVDPSPGGDDPDADSRTGEHDGRGRRGSGPAGDTGGGDTGAGGSGGDGPDPARARRLTFTDTAHGTTLINGELDAEGAALLRTALDGLSAPRPAADGTLDSRSPAQRRADALVELVGRALNADTVPASGGTRPHLVVTIPWNTLLAAGAEPAVTSWGQPLPRGVLNRLSCDAEVTRILLDPAGSPLDVGRSTRTVPPQLRRALIVRDRGCSFPGCDRPPSWCQAHHVIPWTRDGATALHNLVLLCPHHHRTVHHDGWEIVFDECQRPAYIPAHRIDPRGRPRRNPYSQALPDLLSAAS